MKISGRRVLVTGASRGLGRTLAFAFATAGAATTYAGGRRAEDRESLQSEAAAAGAAVIPIALDVTSDRDCERIADLGIDILVNNAGIASFGDPLAMKFEDIQQELEVNYLGGLRMARACAPGMIARHEGMIVNVATAFAKVNLPLVGTYCATKAALLSVGQAMRAYLSDKGIHVMTVMPTTIDTDMSRGANVPKMTKEFVAGEMLRHIREETIDPPIGEEAEGVLAGLQKDPRALEIMLAQLRA
jgi:NAD(P)-dependent dehydrogenase (short-subunit alcohol dehydrogenase family)